MPAEREIIIQVENLVDLLPEKFTGEPNSEDCDEFFRKFRNWLDFHPSKFGTEDLRVNSFHYCLSLTASEWWSKLPAAEKPNTIDALETLFYRKFRTSKTRLQLKAELNSLKYEAGKPFLNMVNKFQTISNRLEWSINVQLEKFIRILPLTIRQFVVSRPYDTFENICKSLTLYQQMIEVENVVTAFKNVSFINTCDLCGEEHESSSCVRKKSAITNKPHDNYVRDRPDDSYLVDHKSSNSPNRNRVRSPSPYSDRNTHRSRDRGRNYPSHTDHFRPRRQSYSPSGKYRSQSYDDNRYRRSNSRDYRPRSGSREYRPRSNSRDYGSNQFSDEFRPYSEKFKFRENYRDQQNHNNRDFRPRSSSRENYYRRPMSRDRNQYDNFRGQNFRFNWRDRSYDQLHNNSQHRFNNFVPQRGNNRPYRGGKNYRSFFSPGTKRSYHTDYSVMQEKRNDDVMINGIKYSAVDSQMSASNLDFH